MIGKTLTIFLFLGTSIAFQGCGQTSDTNSNLAKNSNSNLAVNAVNMSNSNSAMNISNTVQNGNSAANANKKTSPQVVVPPPKIGTGANDMVIFTQIRAKLAEDKDLINNVIVELKEGNATMTGKVLSIEHKEKAEQLIKSVQGTKTVKNNLTVGP